MLWLFGYNTRIDALKYAWWGGLILVCALVLYQIIATKIRFPEIIKFKGLLPFHEANFEINYLDNNILDKMGVILNTKNFERNLTGNTIVISGTTKPTWRNWGIKFIVRVTAIDNQKHNVMVNTRPLVFITIADGGESYLVSKKILALLNKQ